MGYRLITPPTVEPLTLAEIKADLRIDHSDEDGRLARHMAEAREWIERRLGTKLMTQTWEFIIDAFPIEEIRLPFGPVQSITSVKYDDAEGIEQTMAADDYYLDAVSYQVVPEPWLFAVNPWPSTLEAVNSVRIRFVAGHETVALIPAPIKSALSLKVRQLYDGNDTSMQVDNMLGNYQPIVA